MDRAQAVVIERSGGFYRLTRGGRLLLAVPTDLFERFEADEVFPPEWRALDEHHRVRRLYWNPASGEFLMGGLDEHPARLVETFGSAPFRSYLMGFWLPRPPTLLLRPYWNPANPYDDFGGAARAESFRAQWRLWEILADLRPPPGWSAVFNAVDEYLEALGVTPEGPAREDGGDGVREAFLAPPAPLAAPAALGALEALVVGQAGASFPVVRSGALWGVHALGSAELAAAEALLAERGFACQRAPFRPH